MNKTINKRPMGHIAHLKKQFQSINTFAQSYDDTIILVKRKNIIIEDENEKSSQTDRRQTKPK